MLWGLAKNFVPSHRAKSNSLEIFFYVKKMVKINKNFK